MTHLLGIEASGQRRRAHEIDEHDGELAALGAIDELAGLRLLCHRLGRRCILVSNRLQQPASLAQREAELLQILIGEIEEDIHADVVPAKERV